MYSNLNNGMELNINTPNTDVGSFFAHGILTVGAGCVLLAEDADVMGRAGKMTIDAAAGSGASAMGIFCSELDATDSVIKGMANTADIKNSAVRCDQISITCGGLKAKGTSYIFADGRESKSELRGDGLEILSAWSLDDKAVIEAYGANKNAITTSGRTLMPTLGEDYGPKLEYGPDESNVNTVYVLEGEEYAENAYAKISNDKITNALMEHVIAKVGGTTLGIVVSGVKEGERYFISIEKDGEEIGTTENIVSNGTVTAYLRNGNKLEKKVIYTAKLYKYREKEASKSDLVGYLDFDPEEVPVTGDSNNMTLFILLVAAAVAVMALGVKKLVRK